MKPAGFEESTVTLGAPVDWDEAKHGPCGGLPVWHEGDRYISRWRPSWRERMRLLFGVPLWLEVRSRGGHPPVALNIERTRFIARPEVCP